MLVTELAICDGEVAPPEVGEIGQYWLLFAETPPDAGDPSIVTVEVDVEPLDDGVPLRQPAPSPAFLDEERWWEWRLFLRGDGWTATWYSRRPTVGRQRLTGRLFGDLGYATTGSATGRILRARVVSDSYQMFEQPPTEPKRHPRWIPIPGTRTFREVEAATGVFRDDTNPTAAESPAEDAVRECGVLVDLDLDDVPPPPVRPTIVPAAVSAHDRDVWVVDRELPTVIRLREPSTVREYRFPGAILAGRAHRPRWVHADDDGCWVVGRDGIFRCSLDGSVVRIDEQPIIGSAAYNGVLLSWRRTGEHTSVSLQWPGGRHQELEPLDGRIGAVDPGRDGFMGVLHPGTDTDTDGDFSRLFVIDADGRTRLGPPLTRLTGTFFVGNDPRRLVDPRGRQVPIRPDLTAGEVESVPIRGSVGGTAGPWVWVVHPGGDLSVEPNPLSDWHCLLSVLDPVTFALKCRLAVFSPYPEVSYDGEGRMWIVAGGMWLVDPSSRNTVQRVHLA
ncbi:hypothetical protein F1734_21690 [Rhodococcus ruber]|nr:hypothetical protein F1734_21690 [Rhodococcus ruber]